MPERSDNTDVIRFEKGKPAGSNVIPPEFRFWTRSRIPNTLAAIVLAMALLGGDCGDMVAPDDNPPSTDDDSPQRRNDLNAMETSRLTIENQAFEVWLATDENTRQTGLMNTPQGDLVALEDGTRRGMLFVFDEQRPLSFWMLNTIIPLDIAYIRDDGRIVKTYTMAPLETRTYPSVEPARFALEVTAGLFEELGIEAGDTVELPESLLKTVP